MMSCNMNKLTSQKQNEKRVWGDSSGEFSQGMQRHQSDRTNKSYVLVGSSMTVMDNLVHHIKIIQNRRFFYVNS